MASSSSPKVDIPVLISGAGPTGLFAAVLLTKLNIPCRIIERHLQLSPLSKALVIHSRTLEIFAMSNIIDKFLDRGKQVSEFHAYIGSKRAAVLPALVTKESHYGFGLFLEQHRSAIILDEELEALGRRVDRGWELMDTKVVEDPEGGQPWVETTIRRALVGSNVRETESKVLGGTEVDPEEEGKRYETQVVKSLYMIATDGGKSEVRHKLNIGFPGRTLDNSIIIYDGHVECDIPTDTLTAIQGVNDRTMAMFPLHDGQLRIIIDDGVITPEEHASRKSENLTVDQFEAQVNACIAPAKFKCLDCSWLTYYRVNERQAEHFAYKNRIFLAGDAAHVHSPAGGQGMNLGLHDSYNLTWKMALVLHGLAPESLLETYEAERKPVADSIIKLTAKLLEAGFTQGIVRRTIRKIAFTIGPYILPYLSPSANPIPMLTIRYHENAINRPSKSQAVVEGASRSPWKDLSKEIETHLKSWRTKWAYKPISQFPGDSVAKEGVAVSAALPSLPSASSEELFMVHVVASDLSVASSPTSSSPSTEDIDILAENKAGEGKIYLDDQGQLHQKYGVTAKNGAGAIIVVRPDGHIGYRVLGTAKSAWSEVDQYFESILDVGSLVR
ncbi:hypothetical protein BGZ65_012043 [Modicella reniformis]|uniref:FAD-binding domain-containing protein n=1 Tax=Modicella reniformis TaxID=1440133 RepID=A0A9P6MAH2_9FUNG|nr:hypothetical protein BGZ65_012043 [Modicella reniformis]